MKSITLARALTVFATGVVLACGQHVYAASTAIVNAKIYPGDINSAPFTGSILFENGLITEISQETLSADEIIDANGKSVTPGLVGSLNHLGLIEVSAVAESDDSSIEESDLAFTPALAFNPESSAIPLARIGGITRNLVTPGASKNAFAGAASMVDLSGQLNPGTPPINAAVVYLRGGAEFSRAKRIEDIRAALQARVDKSVQSLAPDETEAQDETQKTQPPAKQNPEPDKPSTLAELRLDKLLAKEIPLLAFCDRPADILALLELKQSFDLNLIIAGGDGAVAVKDALAQAGVAVIIDPLNNLPHSFDSLHANLSNAAHLHQAGVKLALSVLYDNTHGLYQLRFGAGNAIAEGLPTNVALAAITSVPADLFNLPSGRLKAGQAADLVLWDNDPFDYRGKVVAMWIDGRQQSLLTRPDQLWQRYTQPSNLPAAYVK